MSALLDFWRNLTGRRVVTNESDGITKGTTQTGKGDQFVTYKSFPELSENFYDYLPDPDAVMAKAGFQPGAYRLIMTDPHVSGVYRQRKSGTAKRTIVFLDGAEDAQSVQARELCERQLMNIKRFKNGNVVKEILDAPFYGMTPLELVWKNVPIGEGNPAGEIVLEDIIGKPFEWFGFTKEGKLGVKDRLGFTSSVKEVPAGKFVNVVNEGTYINPYGDRAAKRIYWTWLFKKSGFKFWVQFLEKYGMPFLYGKADSQKSPEDLVKFQNDLFDMVQNSVVVTQSDGNDEIEVIESKGRSSSTDAYHGFIDVMNLEMSKGLVGETLTVENSQGGSQAATRIHKEVIEDLQDDDTKMTEGALNEICAIITAFNFPSTVTPPTVSLVDETALNAALAERDGKLKKEIGVKFRKSYVSKSYNIPEDQFELSEDPDEDQIPGGTGGGDTPTGNEGAGGGSDFDEDYAEGSIIDGLDAFVEGQLKGLEGLTAETRKKLTAAIQDSNNFNELFEKLTALKDQFTTNEFADVFNMALNTASVVGDWSERNQKI